LRETHRKDRGRNYNQELTRGGHATLGDGDSTSLHAKRTPSKKINPNRANAPGARSTRSYNKQKGEAKNLIKRAAGTGRAEKKGGSE